MRSTPALLHKALIPCAFSIATLARPERIDAYRCTYTARKVFTTATPFPLRVANSVNEHRRVALVFDHGWRNIVGVTSRHCHGIITLIGGQRV